MKKSPKDWPVQTCQLMSILITFGFLIFAAYSFNAGISKQTVYTGAVGYWLGIYLFFSVSMSILCMALILWMAATKRKSWTKCAVTFASAWAITLLAYGAWNFLVQSKYLVGA